MTTRNLLLLSDTHLSSAVELPEEVRRLIEQSDMVIHAGDLNTVKLYDELEGWRPLVAARGNMDEVQLQSLLPEVAVVSVLGHSIGVIHGWGSPRGMVDKIASKVAGYDFDMVVFGHSHYPEITGRDRILFVNPGSPTNRRFAPYCACATVEVTEEEIGAPKVITL